MADPLHEYTVQEILNKTNNYNSYQFLLLTNISASADRSSALSISPTTMSGEIHFIDQTASGAATGPFQLTINDGDEITLTVANLPFTWDKMPVSKIEFGSTTNTDDIAILAYFN
tara:strand:+ start:17 stop:361 length:345 start_codon:yes stop_codon:yes gene_type:complete